MTPSLLLLAASTSIVAPSISIQTMAPKENEECTLTASINIELTDPSYSWSKDGIDLGCDILTYTIPSFTDSDFGTYTFAVTYLSEGEITNLNKDIVIDHYQIEPPAAPAYLVPLLIGVGVATLVFLACFLIFLNKKSKKKKKAK